MLIRVSCSSRGSQRLNFPLWFGLPEQPVLQAPVFLDWTAVPQSPHSPDRLSIKFSYRIFVLSVTSNSVLIERCAFQIPICLLIKTGTRHQDLNLYTAAAAALELLSISDPCGTSGIGQNEFVRQHYR